MDNVLTIIASAAKFVRSPITFSAFVIASLAALATFGFTTPVVLLVTALALPLLVFALLPWKLLITSLPTVAAIVLVILAVLPVAGIAAALYMQRATSSDSYNTEFNLASTYMMNGAYADVIQALEPIPASNARYHEARSQMGLAAFYEGNYGSSLRYYQEALESSRTAIDKARNRYSVARLYLATYNYSNAAALLREEIKNPENFGKARYILNTAVAELGDKKEAAARALMNRFPFKSEPTPLTSLAERDITHRAYLLRAELTWLEKKQAGCQEMIADYNSARKWGPGSVNESLYGNLDLASVCSPTT